MQLIRTAMLQVRSRIVLTEHGQLTGLRQSAKKRWGGIMVHRAGYALQELCAAGGRAMSRIYRAY